MSRTVQEFLKGSGVLIGLFLVLAHYTGFGADVKALGGAYTSGVRALQGR